MWHRCLPGLRRYISTLEARRGGGDGGGGEGEEEKKVETVSPDKDSVDIMEVEAQLNGVLEEERTDVVTRSNNMDVELAGGKSIYLHVSSAPMTYMYP